MTSWCDRTDGELVALFGTHANEACAELYRRHGAAVEATARMMLGNRPECADIVAEVFERLWLGRSHFDPERGSLLTFLRLEARGRSIDLIRSETSRSRRQRSAVPAVSAAGDTEHLALATEEAGAVRRLVATLPELERDAVALAYFADMPYRAVARYLHEPEGTVKSRIRSGLRRLRSNEGLQAICEDASPSCRQPAPAGLAMEA